MSGAINPEYDKVKAAITTALQKVAGIVRFDEVRAAEKKTQAVWPDGFIHQAAIDMGLPVEL